MSGKFPRSAPDPEKTYVDTLKQIERLKRRARTMRVLKAVLWFFVGVVSYRMLQHIWRFVQ